MYTDYLSRKIRRRKIVLTVSVAILFVFIIVFITNTNYSPGHLYKTIHLDDISCHYVRKNDALQTIDEKFFPSSNSIFFHETSCAGRLNSRQACAIESAARSHPDWEIHVLFSAPVSKLGISDVNIELLKLMKNVVFSRVHIVEFTQNTPLEELVASGKINRTLYPTRHTRNVLKYSTLYKWGGVVLNLDTIVTKPLTGLGRNWVIKDRWGLLRPEALAFYRDSVGTLVSDTAARQLAKNFDVIWGQYNENSVITDALKEVCRTNDIDQMTTDECLDFQVHPPSVLLTLNLTDEEHFYSEGDYNSSDIYIYRLLTQPPHNQKVKKDTVYAKLAKRYCPIVYETYRDIFGT